MVEIWEFRAPRKAVGEEEYYAADFRIGDQDFKDAMVATGFPGLVQIPETEFEKLVRAGYIRDVVPISEYIRRVEADPTGGGSSHPAFTIGDKIDRGEFGLGLDTWKEEQPTAPMASWGRSSTGFLRYPSSKVGEADVYIEGVNDPGFFRGAPVMTGQKTLIGLGLIHMLSRISMNQEEIYGYLEVEI